MLTITFVIQVHAVPFRFQILAAITDDKKDKKIPWKPITVEFERIIYKHCGIKKSHVWFDGHFLLKVYQFQNKEEDKDNKWGEAINLCKPKFSLKDEIWSKLLPKGTKGVTFKYKCIQNINKNIVFMIINELLHSNLNIKENNICIEDEEKDDNKYKHDNKLYTQSEINNVYI